MIGTLLTGKTPPPHPEDLEGSKPLAVLLLGPPGAGKGTHAGPLSCTLSIPHISTGDLFRENIRNQTPVGLKAKFYINQGCLVPDEIVLEMLFTRIAGKDCLQGYILDGFPRTVAQAEALDQRLGDTHQLIALHFYIEDALLMERITGRIACRQCGKPFHKRYAPPQQANICDHCHGSLYQRDDDKEEILQRRLEVYRRETEPLIEYYANKAGCLREIDAQNGKERVFAAILESLRALV